MATMTRVTAVPVDGNYAGATAGQAPGALVAPAAGDLAPISSGRGTLFIFITSGTGATVKFSEVVPPPFGTGGDVTVTLAATDLQVVFVANDGTDRFDSGPGTANAGLVALVYTTPTGLKVYAVTIP